MSFGSIDTARYFLAVGVFLALVFALLNPAGSTDAAFPLRLLQWLLQVGIPLALLIGVHLALSRVDAFRRLGAWTKLVLGGLLGSLLFSPLAVGIDLALGVDDPHALGGAGEAVRLWWGELLAVAPTVTLVWLGINAPRVLGLDFRGANEGAPARGANAEAVAATAAGTARGLPDDGGLRSRLPPRVGREIAWLRSELHYLRVATTRGRALVLYNLSDAVDELAGDDGFQPHRSWWVADRHVERLLTREGRVLLRMRDGTEVPVSRRKRAAVRARLGW